MEQTLKYLIVGAGGTGGGLGGFLARAGKDVTLIARGEHLARIRERGLSVTTVDETFSVDIPAYTAEEYEGRPDVVFVCVKGYSLSEAVPLLQRCADEHTAVIPLLNLYGTGRRLQEELLQTAVLDGCIYIASEIKAPGKILMSGRIFRVVFGLRRDASKPTVQRVIPVLEAAARDLSAAGILPVLSHQIETDALIKFSFVSPMAAICAAYDVFAAELQKPGSLRQLFVSLIGEMKALSRAMQVGLPDDIEAVNLKILDELSPTATASMHRDIRGGRQSEVDGLVYEVVRLGQRYQVDMPQYETVAKLLQERLGWQK